MFNVEEYQVWYRKQVNVLDVDCTVLTSHLTSDNMTSNISHISAGGHKSQP